MNKPLEGMRILDFTQFMSGPMCTLILSDFGAEVIKIENPPLGDNTRYGKIIEDQVSSHYAARNRGKKSIVLNMKDQKQRDLFLELVKTADAVVENFKPGTMEKFGITYEVLEKINPRIVYTSISGYGQEGPYAGHPAFDATVQAESGVMSITGPQGGNPTKCGTSIADYSGGLIGCIGTLIGMVDAQRTGHGRRVDVSMMEALTFSLENMISTYMRTGIVPKPNGNRYPASSPIGDFMCKDGVPIMLNISTNPQWKAFALALDQPQWLEDPDFESMLKRAENYQKVEAEVNRVFSQLTSDEVEERMLRSKSVYGRINDFEGLKNHPQMQYRKSIISAKYPNGVTFRVPSNPIIMSGLERETEVMAMPLGANTIEIMSEVADADTVHEIFDPVLEQVKTATTDMYSKS